MSPGAGIQQQRPQQVHASLLVELLGWEGPTVAQHCHVHLQTVSPHPHPALDPSLQSTSMDGAEAELGLRPLQFKVFRKDTAAKHSSETETVTLPFASEQLLL